MDQFDPPPFPTYLPFQVLEMQIQMMLQKLADAEGRQAQLEKENEGLKDQLCTVQFQSEMPSEVGREGKGEGEGKGKGREKGEAGVSGGGNAIFFQRSRKEIRFL